MGVLENVSKAKAGWLSKASDDIGNAEVPTLSKAAVLATNTEVKKTADKLDIADAKVQTIIADAKATEIDQAVAALEEYSMSQKAAKAAKVEEATPVDVPGSPEDVDKAASLLPSKVSAGKKAAVGALAGAAARSGSYEKPQAVELTEPAKPVVVEEKKQAAAEGTEGKKAPPPPPPSGEEQAKLSPLEMLYNKVNAKINANNAQIDTIQANLTANLAKLPEGYDRDKVQLALDKLDEAYKANESRIALKEVVQRLAKGLAMIGAAEYGLKHGVDMSGAKFDIDDFSAEFDRNLKELALKRGQVESIEKEAARAISEKRDSMINAAKASAAMLAGKNDQLYRMYMDAENFAAKQEGRQAKEADALTKMIERDTKIREETATKAANLVDTIIINAKSGQPNSKRLVQDAILELGRMGINVGVKGFEKIEDPEQQKKLLKRPANVLGFNLPFDTTKDSSELKASFAPIVDAVRTKTIAVPLVDLPNGPRRGEPFSGNAEKIYQLIREGKVVLGTNIPVGK